jgi:hypothetical protein
LVSQHLSSRWSSRDPLSITSSEWREPRPVEPPIGVGVRVRLPEGVYRP